MGKKLNKPILNSLNKILYSNIRQRKPYRELSVCEEKSHAKACGENATAAQDPGMAFAADFSIYFNYFSCYDINNLLKCSLFTITHHSPATQSSL